MPDELNKDLGSQVKKDKLTVNIKRTNHLFVIGIDAYLHHPKLNNCIRDCEKLTEVLTTKYDFLPENVTKLYNMEATERKIKSQLRQYVIELGPADNLIIYYSGHGYFDKAIGYGYWVPVDVNSDFPESDYVENSSITGLLRGIRTHHIFLISDSCFSGTLFSGSKATSATFERLDRDPSRWGLTAGRNEVVSEGALGHHSPFAKSLIGFLERNKKSISTAELCFRVLEAVSSNADQTPRGEPLHGVGHQGGQFIFYRKGYIPPADNEPIEPPENDTKDVENKTPDPPEDQQPDKPKELDIIQQIELDGLKSQAEVLAEKLAMLRKSFASMAEGSHKFQLKMEVREAEKQLVEVMEKIKAITS